MSYLQILDPPLISGNGDPTLLVDGCRGRRVPPRSGALRRRPPPCLPPGGLHPPHVPPPPGRRILAEASVHVTLFRFDVSWFPFAFISSWSANQQKVRWTPFSYILQFGFCGCRFYSCYAHSINWAYTPNGT